MDNNSKAKKLAKKFFGFLFDCLDNWIMEDVEKRIKKLQKEFWGSDPVRRRQIITELSMQEEALNCIQERMNRREVPPISRGALPSKV